MIDQEAFTVDEVKYTANVLRDSSQTRGRYLAYVGTRAITKLDHEFARRLNFDINDHRVMFVRTAFINATIGGMLEWADRDGEGDLKDFIDSYLNLLEQVERNIMSQRSNSHEQ